MTARIGVRPEEPAGERPALTGDWWARGVSLLERLEHPLPPRWRTADAPDGGSPRAAAWRAAYTELTEDTLALLTEYVGVSIAEIEYMMAEPSRELVGRVPKPAWATSAEAIIATAGAKGSSGGARLDAGRWQDGFAAILHPFTEHVLTSIQASDAFRDARDTVDADRLTDVLARHVTARLVGTAARTLVWKLHVLRAGGRLAGAGPAERFWSFVEILRTPRALAELLDEHPVLARNLTAICEQAADAFVELLRRLRTDRVVLVQRLFEGRDPGALVDAAFGAGDRHDGGRAVVLLRFASGRRAVYKPRPMAVHAHFNEVMAWFGERLPEASPRRLQVVDRGAYGWVEFVSPEPCVDGAAAERFFFRLGAQLSLLYALAGTDFHFENVIAVADHPVVVDIESILHAGLPTVYGNPLHDDDPALAELRRSVGAVGLLPTMVTGSTGGAIDVGGLGGDAGAVLPFATVDWSDGGTDQMRLMRVHRTAEGGQNKVLLGGEPVEPALYTEQIRAGFHAGYRTIVRHREDLLGPEGILARFAEDDIRILVRGTVVYSRLLDESSHPALLRDALDRERLLSILWPLADADPARLTLAAHELRDIWSTNVPLFWARAGSRDLRTTAGAVVPDLIAEAGLARAQRVIGTMSEADLKRQDWIIRASMATRAQGVEDSRRPSRPHGTAAEADLASRAVAQARRIAARLETTAIRSADRLSWLGLDLVGDERWVVTGLGTDLFNGFAGIGLFFAQLAHVTRDERFAGLAEQVLMPLVRHADRLQRPGGKTRVALGAFSGDCGLAYALASASVLLDDPRPAAPVAGLLSLLTEAVESDLAFDVIDGAAGCLAVAESLVPRFGRSATELAERSAAVLVRAAVPAGDGVGWRQRTFRASQPMLGFSHGAAGIGWALMRHAGRTGDEAARWTGLAAFSYERGEFRAGIDNWPDFRITNARPGSRRRADDEGFHMHAWCHGAPGIGLARSALPAAMRTAQTDGDLRRARASTAAFGMYGNHSLCHGDLGILELFSSAAGIDDDGAAAEHERRVRLIVDQIDERGPLCGTPEALTTPGLMAGWAGIGHGLLRVAAPDRIASVLLLEAQA